MSEHLDRLNAHIQGLQMRLKVTQLRMQLLQDTNLQQQFLVDSLYERVPEVYPILAPVEERKKNGITFVLAAYNMKKQLQRTVETLHPRYQGVQPGEIEVIIVDNGSKDPITRNDFLGETNNYIKDIIRIEGKPSPVDGLNEGIRRASFDTVGIMIDAAHMLSMGVVRNAQDIVRRYNRPVINIPQYILGPISQNLRPESEDAFEEEGLALFQWDWKNNPAALFKLGVLAGEMLEKNPFFAIESNCLITTKEVLESSGGAFNEGFDEPGAGLANLELFLRLTNDPNNGYYLIPGEGSFHQDHGGSTTAASQKERDAKVQKFKDKYKELTGKEALYSARNPFMHGTMRRESFTMPMISRDFGDARTKVISQLANIYIDNGKQGIRTPVPYLTWEEPTDEHSVRATLKPLGIRDKIAEVEGVSHADVNYMSVLAKIHETRKPNFYFEIGVDKGVSMTLSKCPSVGVDPEFDIQKTITAPVKLFRTGSDEFFADQNAIKGALTQPIEMAFIDGMHLSEWVVRDFMNVERYMARDGVVVFDDVLPEQMEMAGRDRPYGAWTGDVYIAVRVLQDYRPDLKVNVFNAFIGPYRKGVAVITGVDPKSTVLKDKYPEIEKKIKSGHYDISSIEELERVMPVARHADLPGQLAAAGAR